MGAIYLDKGYKTCQKFVQKQILGRLMDLDGVANKEVNFKSKLLEWCQKNKLKHCGCASFCVWTGFFLLFYRVRAIINNAKLWNLLRRCSLWR